MLLLRSQGWQGVSVRMILQAQRLTCIVVACFKDATTIHIKQPSFFRSHHGRFIYLSSLQPPLPPLVCAQPSPALVMSGLGQSGAGRSGHLAPPAAHYALCIARRLGRPQRFPQAETLAAPASEAGAADSPMAAPQSHPPARQIPGLGDAGDLL